MLCSDAKEIDPSDIEMKERLGAGQFGVSLSTSQTADEEFCTCLCILYLLRVDVINCVLCVV